MNRTGVELARELLDYCKAHPKQRFWQALRNWSGQAFINAVSAGEELDTFYWKGKGPE